MPSIRCLNTDVDKGNITRCNRFLAIVPDCVIDALAANPGESLVMRCPLCPSYQRWAKIYYKENYGLTWEAIEKPPIDKEIKFDLILNSEQVL